MFPGSSEVEFHNLIEMNCIGFNPFVPGSSLISAGKNDNTLIHTYLPYVDNSIHDRCLVKIMRRR